MSEKTVAKFTTTRPNSRVIMPDGKSLYFKGNVMLVEEYDEITYMRSLVKCSEGCISERPVDESDTEDPIEKIKAAAIAEYLAKQVNQPTAPASTSATPVKSIDVKTK